MTPKTFALDAATASTLRTRLGHAEDVHYTVVAFSAQERGDGDRHVHDLKEAVAQVATAVDLIADGYVFAGPRGTRSLEALRRAAATLADETARWEALYLASPAAGKTA